MGYFRQFHIQTRILLNMESIHLYMHVLLSPRHVEASGLHEQDQPHPLVVLVVPTVVFLGVAAHFSVFVFSLAVRFHDSIFHIRNYTAHQIYGNIGFILVPQIKVVGVRVNPFYGKLL